MSHFNKYDKWGTSNEVSEFKIKAHGTSQLTSAQSLKSHPSVIHVYVVPVLP